MIILLFGQPCSGKTTLAKEIYQSIQFEKKIHIDGDEFRAVVGNTGYDRNSRLNNVKSAFDMALFLESKGYIVVLSFVTPYKESRQYLKDRSPNTRFFYLEYDASENRGRESYHVSDFEMPTATEHFGSHFTSINTSIKTKTEAVMQICFLLKDL
jgi:adenylylsulfate kinase